MANRKNKRAVQTPAPTPPAGEKKPDMLRNPIAMNDYQAIQQIRNAANMAGVKSFILLFPTTDATKPGDLAIHLQEMPFRTALNAMINGLNYAVNVEIDRHPEFSETYKRFLRGFIDGVHAQVKQSNEDLARIGK